MNSHVRCVCKANADSFIMGINSLPVCLHVVPRNSYIRLTHSVRHPYNITDLLMTYWRRCPEGSDSVESPHTCQTTDTIGLAHPVNGVSSNHHSSFP